MVLNNSHVVVIAPGKRPATFRTWKLSPAAPMVLQPTGCGRVGHRHNTLQASGQEPNGSWPLRYPTQQNLALTTDTHKTTHNKHTSTHMGPLKCMWSRSCEPGQPRPRTRGSTRPSPPSASKPATTVHRARGRCLRPSGYGATHERTYVAHILPLGMGS